MAGLSVNVSIAKLGTPDESFTAKQLDAYEIVKFLIAPGSARVGPLTVAQIGGCNYVDDCPIEVPVEVKYWVASDFQTAIANATTTAEKNGWRSFRLRIKWHAEKHYDSVADSVIPAWKTDILKDLNKTVPTRGAPTSLQESDILLRITELVTYWVDELGYRIARDVNDWEQKDYPKISKLMTQVLPVFLPQGLPIPPFLLKPPSRPSIAFPACRPKNASKRGNAE
jgi:hypothetical protein